MRRVRCQRCGYMFTLSRELVEAALEEMEARGADHYTVECRQCRHAIKITRQLLERMRPQGPMGEAEGDQDRPHPSP